MIEPNNEDRCCQRSKRLMKIKFSDSIIQNAKKNRKIFNRKHLESFGGSYGATLISVIKYENLNYEPQNLWSG